MAAPVTGIPVLILKEGTKRTIGAEAQMANIAAAKALAEAIYKHLIHAPGTQGGF